MEERIMINELINNASEYDFFQLITLLRELEKKEENIRFSVPCNLTFPTADIESLHYSKEEDSGFHLVVNFLGLTGPSGILPPHYTEYLINQSQQKKFAVKDFFDLIHQRALLFYYKSWVKTHFYVNFNCKNRHDQPNDIMEILCSHVGFSSKKDLHGLNFIDNFVLSNAGIFSKKRPTLSELCTLIEHYLQLHVEVIPFCKSKYYFTSEQISFFPNKDHPTGNHCYLSTNARLGDAIDLYQNSFKVVIYVKDFSQWNDLLPGGTYFKTICDIIQYYVGIEYSFKLELGCNLTMLGSTRLGDPTTAKLGWNSWINHQKNNQAVCNILSTIH